MKVQNIGLKDLRVKNEQFRDYVRELQREIIRLGSTNILDYLSFEEIGDDAFSVTLEGKKVEGMIDDNVESFLVGNSIYDIDGLRLNVAHNVQALSSIEKNSVLVRPTAVAVPITQEGSVLLVQKKVNSGWSLPQGGVDFVEGNLEDVTFGLLRELEEELNLSKNFSVYPTYNCVLREIPFGRSKKTDVFDNGVVRESSFKEYHFYFVGLSDSPSLILNESELHAFGLFEFDSDEFNSMSEFKQDVACDVISSIDFYRSKATNAT
jgi:8-oxo-dGTP pyrophosphatase MutT (NUDIX family)